MDLLGMVIRSHYQQLYPGSINNRSSTTEKKPSKVDSNPWKGSCSWETKSWPENNYGSNKIPLFSRCENRQCHQLTDVEGKTSHIITGKKGEERKQITKQQFYSGSIKLPSDLPPLICHQSYHTQTLFHHMSFRVNKDSHLSNKPCTAQIHAQFCGTPIACKRRKRKESHSLFQIYSFTHLLLIVILFALMLDSNQGNKIICTLPYLLIFCKHTNY